MTNALRLVRFAAPAAVTFVSAAAVAGGPLGQALPQIPHVEIVVTELTTDADCHVVAKFANKGTLPIPQATENVTYGYSSPPKGGEWMEPANTLRTVGASTTWNVPTFQVVGSQPVTVWVTIGSTHFKRTETLSCAAKLPDLVLTVRVKPDCSKTIEVKNFGDGPVFGAAYMNAQVGILRDNDGLNTSTLPLSTIDPSQALLKPGGKVTYEEPADFRAYHEYSYSLPYPWQERSSDNNIAKGTMPASCNGQRPLYDLKVTDITLDSSCRIWATLTNGGPGKTSPIAVDTTFTLNGVWKGVWATDIAGLAPGASVRAAGPSLPDKNPTTVHVGTKPPRATLLPTPPMAPKPESEKNDEMTKTLTCK